LLDYHWTVVHLLSDGIECFPPNGIHCLWATDHLHFVTTRCNCCTVSGSWERCIEVEACMCSGAWWRGRSIRREDVAITHLRNGSQEIRTGEMIAGVVICHIKDLSIRPVQKLVHNNCCLVAPCPGKMSHFSVSYGFNLPHHIWRVKGILQYFYFDKHSILVSVRDGGITCRSYMLFPWLNNVIQ